MIDESFDKEQMEGPAQPWEFRSKPAWQRLIIMLGGVIVNFILGLFIYSMMMWYFGDKFFPAENITEGIAITHPVMTDMGFENGDKILKVGNRSFDKFEPNILTTEIVLNNANKIQIERNGQPMTLTVHDSISNILSSYGRGLLFAPRSKTVIKEISKNSNASKAGLLAGDQIVSVDGNPTVYTDQFTDLMSGIKSRAVELGVIRNGALQNMTVDVNAQGRLVGFVREQFLDQYESESIRYGFFEAIPAGILSLIHI